jgi:hypothetical protein
MRPPLIPRIPDDWTVWAFSDPHGVATGLEAALVAAGIVDGSLRWIAPPGTALVGCGDYLDRGADSPRVIALLRGLEPQARAAGGRAVFARGNHEHLLFQLAIGASDRFDTWLEYGGRATLDAYGCGGLDPVDPRSTVRSIEERAPGMLQWLDHLAHAVRWRDVLFVHGGLPPWADLDDLGRDTEKHLWVRSEFYGTPWATGAFGGFEAAGVHRVVFGHSPRTDGAVTFHDGRSLCIDTNACGNPHLSADAQRMITLVELVGDIPFAEARLVTVRTDAAPDRART